VLFIYSINNKETGYVQGFINFNTNYL